MFLLRFECTGPPGWHGFERRQTPHQPVKLCGRVERWLEAEQDRGVNLEQSRKSFEKKESNLEVKYSMSGET